MSHKRASRDEKMRCIVAIAMLVLVASAIIISNSYNIGSAVRVEEISASALSNPSTSDDLLTFILFGAIFGTIAALALVKLQIKLGRR